MEYNTKKWIVLLFVGILLAAVYKDTQNGELKKDSTIVREEANGEEKEVHLIVNGGELLEDYEYHITLEPVAVTEEEAEAYFIRTREQIAIDFENVTTKVPSYKKYEDGMVKAKWRFPNCECINAKGEVQQKLVPTEGLIVTTEVKLSCGEYEQIYTFPFRIEKKVLTQKEQLIEDLETWIEIQQQSHKKEIQLPTEWNGIDLEWSEKKESLTLQVLMLEVVAIVLIVYGRKKQNEAEEKQRVQRLEMEYSDIVSQLSILIEAGMTTRQAWNRMTEQYIMKRKRGCIVEKPVMEALVCMNRRLLEGESERVAYQKFARALKVRCYDKFMRVLSNHIEKGTMGLCIYLENESRQAYEQRILTAKRIGEEASTKMLIPMMMMLLLVMIIILLPGVIGLKI